MTYAEEENTAPHAYYRLSLTYLFSTSNDHEVSALGGRGKLMFGGRRENISSSMSGLYIMTRLSEMVGRACLYHAE